MLYRVNFFMDGDGRVVEVHEPLNEGGQVRFLGKASVRVTTDNGGVHVMPIEVPLSAQSLVEAFTVYDAQVREKGAAIAQERLRAYERILRESSESATGGTAG